MAIIRRNSLLGLPEGGEGLKPSPTPLDSQVERGAATTLCNRPAGRRSAHVSLPLVGRPYVAGHDGPAETEICQGNSGRAGAGGPHALGAAGVGRPDRMGAEGA